MTGLGKNGLKKKSIKGAVLLKKPYLPFPCVFARRQIFVTWPNTSCKTRIDYFISEIRRLLSVTSQYRPYAHFGYSTLTSNPMPNKVASKVESDVQKVPKYVEAKRDGVINHKITLSINFKTRKILKLLKRYESTGVDRRAMNVSSYGALHYIFIYIWQIAKSHRSPVSVATIMLSTCKHNKILYLIWYASQSSVYISDFYINVTLIG